MKIAIHGLSRDLSGGPSECPIQPWMVRPWSSTFEDDLRRDRLRIRSRAAGNHLSPPPAIRLNGTGRTRGCHRLHPRGDVSSRFSCDWRPHPPQRNGAGNPHVGGAPALWFSLADHRARHMTVAFCGMRWSLAKGRRPLKKWLETLTGGDNLSTQPAGEREPYELMPLFIAQSMSVRTWALP